MRRWLRIVLFCVTSLTLISWDRVTKEMAKAHLKDTSPVSLFHNTMHLMYVENTGAAMSLGDHLNKTSGFWLLNIIPLIFLLALLVYVIKKLNEMNLSKALAFSLIIAGGMGNIIDRIFFDRHVTDFMVIGYGKLHTGVFNFADLCITTGGCLLLLLVFKKSQAANC